MLNSSTITLTFLFLQMITEHLESPDIMLDFLVPTQRLCGLYVQHPDNFIRDSHINR